MFSFNSLTKLTKTFSKSVRDCYLNIIDAQNRFDKIPDNVVMEILNDLALRQLVEISTVSKRFHQLSNDQISRGYPNRFDCLPNEIILNIMNNLSPKQLANASHVCKKFNAYADVYLSNIKHAFFNTSSISIESGEDHYNRFDYKTDKKMFKTYNKDTLSKQLLTCLSQYVCSKNTIAAYIKQTERHKQGEDSFYEQGLPKLISQNHYILLTIVHLLERGADATMKIQTESVDIFAGSSSLPDIQSPVEYATKYKKKCPELLVLLNEYLIFQKKQDDTSLQSIVPVAK